MFMSGEGFDHFKQGKMAEGFEIDEQGSTCAAVDDRQPRPYIVVAPRRPSGSSIVMQLPPEDNYQEFMVDIVDDDDSTVSASATTTTDAAKNGRRKKCVMGILATIVLLAIVIGLGAGLGTSGRGNGVSSAMSAASGVTLEDCLAEEDTDIDDDDDGDEESTPPPTSAPTGEPTVKENVEKEEVQLVPLAQTAFEVRKPIDENDNENGYSLDDGSVRRDLRGGIGSSGSGGRASKKVERVATAFKKQRKLECEELLGASDSAKVCNEARSIQVTIPCTMHFQDLQESTAPIALREERKDPVCKTISDVAKDGLSEGRSVKSCEITSRRRLQSGAIKVNYELVINELCCARRCEELAASTTVYDDVTSRITLKLDENLEGLNSDFQSNVDDCERGCDEFAVLRISNVTFEENDVVVEVLTNMPTNSPTMNPTASKSPETTSRPTNTPTLAPYYVPGLPSRSPIDPPTDNPTRETKAPTDEPTQEPTNQPTLKPVTGSSSKEPTTDEPTLSKSPTDMPTLAYYQYRPSTTECRGVKVAEGPNIDGPSPLEDKSNVAVQFYVFGNTPYDRGSKTCIGEDGVTTEEECTRFNCGTTLARELPSDNTCTFEGEEYNCVQKYTIPYMNKRIADGDAAFMVHAGDFISGSGLAVSNICTQYTFASRRDLFSSGTNFLNVPGDNDWNECSQYDIGSNTDASRELWRDYFSREDSPFNQFSTSFPQPGGELPSISRKDGNPEIWFFDYNKVAIFGLNNPDRSSYVKSEKINDAWVEERLKLDESACTYESIVLISHTSPDETLYTKIEDYFKVCGDIPILTVTGNLHPRSYCMSQEGNRVNVIAEAFKSAPLLISVVRDPNGSKGADYVHILDVDDTDSNSECPSFESVPPTINRAHRGHPL